MTIQRHNELDEHGLACWRWSFEDQSKRFRVYSKNPDGTDSNCFVPNVLDPFNLPTTGRKMVELQEITETKFRADVDCWVAVRMPEGQYEEREMPLEAVAALLAPDFHVLILRPDSHDHDWDGD